MQGSRIKAARATERLREMVSELGPCSELLTSRVPLPLNPHLLLEGLVPEECTCFRSAMLPVKLSYRLNPKPIDWTAAQPLMPPPSSAAAAVLTHQSSAATAAAAAAAAAGHMHHGGLAAQGSIEAGGLGVSGGVEGLGGSGSSSSGAVAAYRPTAASLLEGLPSKTGVVVQGEQLRCVMIYKKGDDLRQVCGTCSGSWGTKPAVVVYR